MAFLRKKILHGSTYYYYVEKQRVNGKPVDKTHIYLGTAEEILNKVKNNNGNTPIALKSFEYGKIAALLAIDEELGFRQLVNSVTSKRNENALSVGDLILISIFGRWIGQLSKSATSRYFSDSFLAFGRTFPSKVNAENIISSMDYLDKDTISSIELGLAKKLVEKGMMPDMIVWDTTNNYTFIEHGGEIPQKGKSKQERYSKNLIGLGMAVTGDNIPFMHKTVPGNTSDSTLFNKVIDDIIVRLREIKVNSEGLVLVMDKGNNSEDNLKAMQGKIKVLGSLKKNQVKDLMEVPEREYRLLYTTDNGTEIRGFSRVISIYGKEYRIVVSMNPSTREKQISTYEKSKVKILDKLKEIEKSMNKSGKGRHVTASSAIKKAVKAVYPQYASIIKYDITEGERGKEFKYWIDSEAESEYKRDAGKLVLFTDMDGWSEEKIVKTYNRKVFIEDDFHWLKDKVLIPLTPVWHRTDEHIRVHVFICVMGLFFVRYISNKLKGLGMTDESIFEELSKIRVAIVSDKDLKGPEVIVEPMSTKGAMIFSKLDLGRYLKGNSF
ncbi:MAG: IS1634 family transposase [bacterium]